MAKKHAAKTARVIKPLRASAHQPLAAKHDATGKTIHALISDLVNELSPLRWGTSDPNEQVLLEQQMDELDDLNFKIFKFKIQTNTAAWGDAADAITEASDAAQAAQDDMDKVVDTLKKVGKAIALIAKLVVLLG